MAAKQKVTITVSGRAGTGKSTMMSLIANQLEAFGIEVEQQPFRGEPVVIGPLAARLSALSPTVVVIIKEQSARVESAS